MNPSSSPPNQGSPPAQTTKPPNGSAQSSAHGTSASGISTILADAPTARLCHLVRRPEYDGYGFKLIASQQGNLPRVTAVESGSPAEAAGLRANDTVVEVNGAILEGLGQQDVVQLVKSTPNEAKLLVVDEETAAWYKRHGIALRGDLLSVVHVSSKGSSRKVRRKNGTTSSGSQSSDSMTPSELAGGLRLCYLRKWPNYEGYGFSLREDKQRQGYFITNVVPDSPAELGGLRDDDRLIEVNAVSVENKSYQEIMGRINKEPDQVDLLVIDRETDQGFTNRRQKPSGQADGVLRRWTPARPPRMTYRKIVKQKPVVGSSSSGAPAIPQMDGASHQLVTASTPPVAEYGTAVSERCHIVKEDGTLTECPPQLSAAQTVLVNCASPVPTPKKGIDSTGHASISVGSSEARSPGEPTEGLRLCHLCKWPNFDGYGFALKADRNRNGQFVANVDRGSPAHLGGLRKKDRIVEVNGESVEGASYRDVVNRIKLDPGKVVLLVIDRETDEEFARQGRTPSSHEGGVAEFRTPPAQPQSYAENTDSSRTAITSHTPIMLQHGSAAADKLPSNEHTKYVWAVKPLSQSMPLLANRPMTIASEFRRCDDEATSHRNNQAKCQPVKSESRDTAKPSPKLYTIQEAPSPPTTAATTFMTSQLRASAEPCDNGSPTRCRTRNAADYFPAFDETAAINSTQFTPTHSGSPEDGNSPYDSPLRAAPPTASQNSHPASAPGLTGYASSQPCGPFCPAQIWLSMSFQAPYVPLEPVRQQERTTTYAPGYSDFLSMYSGYASSSPLKSATETTAVFQTLSEPHGAGADIETSRRSAAVAQPSSSSIVARAEPADSTRSSTFASCDEKGAEASDKSDRANLH